MQLCLGVRGQLTELIQTDDSRAFSLRLNISNTGRHSFAALTSRGIDPRPPPAGVRDTLSG